MTKHDTLYQVDKKGKVRTWWMETDGGSYRTVTGIKDGKLVESGWTITKPKNVGKANATTVEQQALLEVEAQYTKKLENKYYTTIEEATEAGTGAKFLEPMLAEKWEDAYLDDNQVLYTQPKLDGIRATGKPIGLLSRRGKAFVSCPHIVEEIKRLMPEGCEYALDGELYNHLLKDDFNEVTSLVKKQKPTAEDYEETRQMVQYHVYDIVMPGKFSERMDFLNKYFQGSEYIKIVDTRRVIDKEMLDSAFGEWLEEGYEGQMIRLDSEYEHRRTYALMKRKEFMDAEFELDSLSEGIGNWAGYIKSVKFILPGDVRKENGERPDSGVAGSQKYLKEVLDRVNAGDPPTHATIRFQNYTPGGIPRFPVVKKFYWGKRDD